MQENYEKLFRPKTAAEIADQMIQMLPHYIGQKCEPGSNFMAMIEMFALQLHERDLMMAQLWNQYNPVTNNEQLKQLDNLEICEPLYSEEKPKVIAKECECGKEKHGLS